jgi:hypothetical protein
MAGVEHGIALAVTEQVFVEAGQQIERIGL